MLRTYRTVNFCNRDSFLEESCGIDIGPRQVQSADVNFLCEQSTLSRMTDAYIYSLKPVLELGLTDQQLDTLTTQTVGAAVKLTVTVCSKHPRA